MKDSLCFSFLLFISFILCSSSNNKDIDLLINHFQNSIIEGETYFSSKVDNKEEILSKNLTTVQTSLGNIIGIEENGYRLFKGIPYASPPVGSNRWQPPKNVEAWNNDLLATEFSSACPQMQKSVNTTPFITTSMSEDCLYLNIWAPLESKLNGENVPVMVWFHGGAFWTGWGGDGLFWGDYLVNSTSNTIIVTINYRLGALGFMVTPELSGNYGFLDQQKALQWVQDHISNFGGDPSSVTIFGQSAGAMSVTLHTISPSSNGLFSRAICESNPAGINYRTAEQSYPYSEKVAGLLNCSYTDTDCLLSKSWEDIVDAQLRGYMINIPITTLEFLPYSPIIDGTIIPDQPMNIFRSGHVNSNIKGMVFGTNRNESLAIFPIDVPINAFIYKTLVNLIFSDNSTKVLDQYPASRTENNLNQFSILTTDWLFLCASRYAATAFSNSNVPTFMYNFMHVPSYDPINYTKEPCLDAVCHSAEIPYVHNSVDFVVPGSFTQDEQNLSWGFVNYWINFAHGKVQSNMYGPEWPKFNITTDKSLDFDVPQIGILQDYHSDNCAFWDSFGYYN